MSTRPVGASPTEAAEAVVATDLADGWSAVARAVAVAAA